MFWATFLYMWSPSLAVRPLRRSTQSPTNLMRIGSSVVSGVVRNRLLEKTSEMDDSAASGCCTASSKSAFFTIDSGFVNGDMMWSNGEARSPISIPFFFHESTRQIPHDSATIHPLPLRYAPRSQKNHTRLGRISQIYPLFPPNSRRNVHKRDDDLLRRRHS